MIRNGSKAFQGYKNMNSTSAQLLERFGLLPLSHLALTFDAWRLYPKEGQKNDPDGLESWDLRISSFLVLHRCLCRSWVIYFQTYQNPNIRNSNPSRKTDGSLHLPCFMPWQLPWTKVHLTILPCFFGVVAAPNTLTSAVAPRNEGPTLTLKRDLDLNGFNLDQRRVRSYFLNCLAQESSGLAELTIAHSVKCEVLRLGTCRGFHIFYPASWQSDHGLPERVPPHEIHDPKLNWMWCAVMMAMGHWADNHIFPLFIHKGADTMWLVLPFNFQRKLKILPLHNKEIAQIKAWTICMFNM